MKKVCHFCGNKNFKTNKVQYIYKYIDKFLIVNDVPCLQCEYCGEQYFKGEILKRIENEFNEIYSIGKKPKNTISIPIEQYTDIKMVDQIQMNCSF